MKNTIKIFSLIFFLTLFANQIFAQYTDYYSSASPWFIVGPPTQGNGVGNNVEVNSTSHPGVCYFTQMYGSAYSDSRAYHQLASAVSNNSWTLFFDFKLENLTGGGSGFFPMVLTSGRDPIDWDDLQTGPTNQNTLGVCCASQNEEDIVLMPWYKVGTTGASGMCQIHISLNTTYRICLERLSLTRARFSVFERTVNGTDTLLAPACCFEIPESLLNLEYVQTGNGISAGWQNAFYGYVDNLKILDYNLTTCCPATQIIGEDTLCSQFCPITYYLNSTVQTGVVFNWVLPTGITFTGQGTSSITITNWGSNYGLIPIKVYWECNCQLDSLIKNVYVQPNLSAFGDFTLSVTTQNPIISNIKCTPITNLPSGVTQTWEVFLAANCNNGDYTISGSSLRPIVNTDPYDVVSPDSPYQNLLMSNCYVIRRILSYDNGLCPNDTTYHKVSISKGKSQNSNNTGNPTSNSLMEPKVYPNPTNDILFIELADTKIDKLFITNSLGQIVLTKEVNNLNKIKLSTKDLSKGIYLINFNGKDYSKSIKFTKN